MVKVEVKVVLYISEALLVVNRTNHTTRIILKQMDESKEVFLVSREEKEAPKLHKMI